MKDHFRRPLFGTHGHKVVVSFCAWELVALTPHTPLPSISQTVRRYPFFGLTILGMLVHHWYLER